MDNIAGDRLDGEDQESGYPDVSRLPLRELIAADDTVLDHSMRRLLAEMDRPQEIIAAFSSYVR
jgi:FXSXX-COOH protein